MLLFPLAGSAMKQLEVIYLYEQFKDEHARPPTQLKITRDDWTDALSPSISITDESGEYFFMGMAVEFAPSGSPQVS